MKTVKGLKGVKRRILIGTHSNIFHIGEVVAISILCIAHEDDEIVIIRTKKYEELEKCDYVVNMGEGNGENGRYGHYHRVNEKRKDGSVFGNAGFVWRDFGDQIIKKLFDKEILKNKKVIEKMFVTAEIARGTVNEQVKLKVDADLIQNVDMHQNGIKLEKDFNYIHSFLPKWYVEESYETLFDEVLEITQKIVKRYIIKKIDEVLAQDEINNRLTYGFYGNKRLKNNILEIPKQHMPWINVVIDYNNNIMQDKNIKEKEQKIVQFVMFPYHRGGWAAQCVPSNKKNIFEKIVPFPKEWAGESTNLPKITGVNDAIYCHKTAFFVRAASREGIIKLCMLAQKLYNK